MIAPLTGAIARSSRRRGNMRPASRGAFRKRPCTERADAPRPARPPIEAYPQRYGEGGQRSRRGCSGPRMPGSYGNGPLEAGAQACGFIARRATKRAAPLRGRGAGPCPLYRGDCGGADAGGGVSGAFRGGRASTDVRVHRTSSDEAKTPSEAAERVKAPQSGAFATERAGIPGVKSAPGMLVGRVDEKF